MRTVCFIHGLNSSFRSFNYLADKIRKDCEIVYVNYQSKQRLEDSVTEVLKQIPEGEVTLVGHSLGGVIALLIANRQLANVQEVITISSPLGGSSFAAWARWVMIGMPILSDITPMSPGILELKNMKKNIQLTSIISTGGSLPTSTKPNDSIVSVRSQKALKIGKKTEVKANHFEILMHERTVKLLQDLLR